MAVTFDTSSLHHIFPGESEMARRMRDFDWASTALGIPQNWPGNLRAIIGIALNSQFPILVWWGPDLLALYNDAYIPYLGATKHPQCLARPGRDCWRELWPVIGPMLDGVMKTGEATGSDQFQFFFDRYLPREEVYFRFTYDPILSPDASRVDGVFTPCTDITEQVVGARRLETLRKLGARGRGARTVGEAARKTAEVMAQNPYDIPFSAVYLLEQDGRQAARIGASDGAVIALPAVIALADGDAVPWPLAAALRERRAQEVDLGGLGLRVPGGAWDEPATRALVLPIGGTANRSVIGFLVAGVSPRRVLDDAYRSFFEMVARHIGVAITDAQAHEEERARAEALAELDRAKTLFFSNVSHEFRTPLTLMLGPLQDMLDHPERCGPDSRPLLLLAQRNSQRLLKLVNSLLDFARIEAGRMQASYAPTDLAAFTADLAGVFRSAVEKAGMQLAVDCPPLPQLVYVDRDMWEKIVLNLISNAFKYTLAGEIAVTLRAQDGHAVLSVRDTGTGIVQSELPKLFTRFYRVENARGRSTEGSGIGLSMVLELVRLHGGTIAVDSQPGKGSTFTVRIPFGCAHLPAGHVVSGDTPALPTPGVLAFLDEARGWIGDIGTVQADAIAIEAPPHAMPQGKTRPRVLVADDNADLRAYLRQLLENQFEVVTVADGLQALRTALEFEPDLVLTDVMMPGLDGFALLRALRAKTATAATSVILLSARAGEEARIEGMQAGADDYLVKPFSARELLARVGGMVTLARFRRKAIDREQALRAMTASLLEGMDEGCVSVDPDWRITYVNAEAERLTRMPRNRLLGVDHWKAFPAVLGTVVEEKYRYAMARRVPVRFDYFYPPASRWMEIGASPLSDGGLLLNAHDITDRKLAEEALHAAQASLSVELKGMSRLHALGTRLLAATHLVDALREVLNAATEMLGADMGGIQLFNRQQGLCGVATLSGLQVDFLPLFLHAMAGSACERALRSGQRFVIEDVQAGLEYLPYRAIVDAAGVRALQLTPLMSRDGRALGVLFTCWRAPHRSSAHELRMLDLYAHQAIEMIERIRAEEALRKSEERSNMILSSTTDAFMVINADGRFTYFNDAAVALFAEQGMRTADLIGKQYLTETLQEARDDDSGRGYLRAMRERVPVAVETFYIPFNRWYSIRFFPMAEGGLEVVVQDITERKRAEQALRESEARFRALTDASPALIWQLDRDGKIAYLNQRWFEHVASDGKDMMRDGWRAVLHPDDAPACLAELARATHERTRLHTRMRVRFKDGNWHWLEAYSMPWFTDDGLYAGRVGIAIDVTETVLAEAALREANRNKDEFLSILGHELRNPLSAISSAVSLLGHTTDAAAIERLTGIVTRQLGHIVRLVDDLLEVSRISQGKIEMRKAPTELGAVLRSAVEMCRSAIEEAGQQLNVSLPAEPLMLDADAVRLAQVFGNLLNNAAKYTEPGGRIWLTAERQGDQACVSVRDNGIGIAPEMMQRVFEMFAQAHRELGRGQGGLGIGLALARSIVEMHGGSVEAHSDGLGKGSEFTVRLPLAGTPNPGLA